MQIEYDCTLSILVEKQPSMLYKITGLLTRRGFKVDSLVIGSTEYYKTFRLIIILPGNMRIVDQITQQLYKLLPVIKIQDLTHLPYIRRELILFKVLATPEDRSRILEIATFFRAKILDFAENILTLEVTGDSEKIIALEQLIHKFGVLELVRTGKIAMIRESIANTQLFTKQRELNRKKILHSYITELEDKLYLI
jgi:acetolactate synthase I/III small subunit